MSLVKDKSGLYHYAHHSVDTLWVAGSMLAGVTPTTGAGTFPAANLIIYCPVRVTKATRVKKLWIAAQNTAGAPDTLVLGVYGRGGTKLFDSGNITHPATSDEIVANVTNAILPPSLYYLAVTQNATAGTFQRFAPGAPIPAAMGLRTEAGAGGLPATATWVVDNTLNFVPIMGMLLGETVT
jgi:hypothetical protein